MSVLFLILKIIGILILIPIILLLILLMFPICYQIEGDFDGKIPKAQVKVSWAVIFLRAKACYEEQLDFGIRIFGIPVYDSRKDHWSVLGEHPEKDKKHKKKDKKKRKARSNTKKKSTNKTDSKKQADTRQKKIEKKERETKQEKYTVQEKVPDKKVVQEAKDTTIKKTSEDVLDLTWDEKEEKQKTTTQKTYRKPEDTTPKPEIEKSTDKEKEFFGKKIVNLLKKCYNKCKNLITKIRKITDKMETIGDIFEDEDIINAVKRIKGYGINAVKLLLPQKLNAQITFGFEDPYHTGKVLGWAAALIPIYGDHIDITPDFEKRTLKGHLRIKGSIRRYKILHLLWKVYKDKDELIKQKDRALRMIGGN